jgi:GDP-L-fucose synthase
MEKNSKIYIAGNTGMVGSSILRNLQGKGYSNFVFTPWPEYDLTDQVQTAEFFEKEKPEYVFLAAAKVGGIIANNTYRAQFIYENLMIQNNIIHSAYKYGVKKLLFLGSSCIYPKKAPQPLKEEYLLTGPLEYTNEPYAIAKIAGIKMCESYYKQFGCNFISVMPTNLYGPNDNYNLETSHVLPALIRKMHLGKCLLNNDWNAIRKDLYKNPVEGINGSDSEEKIIEILSKHGIITGEKVIIELWGTGKPSREFLHVNDMAAACVFIMETIDFDYLVKINTVSNEIRNTHINIGTGIDITIKDLAYLIQKIVGYKSEIVWNTNKPDGTLKKQLDVEKLHKSGWKEKICLNDGITLVYEEYQK